MIKFIADSVRVWDAEWIPDVETIRRAYDVPSDLADSAVMYEAFRKAGATDENPRPFLKTALCRVVCIAGVSRTRGGPDGITLRLSSIPKVGQGAIGEAEVLRTFLSMPSRPDIQLIGFNSRSADVPALIQRALVHRLCAKKFCEKPNKPWEGKDYFAKFGDWHVDLIDVLSGFGKGTPSLNELCAALGIPTKGKVAGGDVLDLWLAGDVDTIVRYCHQDALRTYLLWLRVCLLCGLFTPEEHIQEEYRLCAYLSDCMSKEPERSEHLRPFIEALEPEVAHA